MEKVVRHIIPILFAATSILCFVCGIHIQRTEAFAEQSMVLYQFCHVNIWHVLANLACLYTIASSTFRTSWHTWLAAYVISAFVPCMSPTEGMSGLLYALMGIISWQAADTRKFHLWCIGFMGICFLFPHTVNGWLHVFCYLAGVMYGLATVIYKLEFKK